MTTTNRRPWVNIEPQPIVLAGSRKHRVPSFHETVTVVGFVPGRQKSRTRLCHSCATPSSSSDCYCGWCGTQL